MGVGGSDRFRKKYLASAVVGMPLSYLCSEPCLAVGKTVGVNVNRSWLVTGTSCLDFLSYIFCLFKDLVVGYLYLQTSALFCIKQSISR